MPAEAFTSFLDLSQLRAGGLEAPGEVSANIAVFLLTFPHGNSLRISQRRDSRKKIRSLRLCVSPLLLRAWRGKGTALGMGWPAPLGFGWVAQGSQEWRHCTTNRTENYDETSLIPREPNALTRKALGLLPYNLENCRVK